MIQPVQERLLGAQYCSYRVGGPLDEPYLPKTMPEAMDVLAMVREKHRPLTVLGGGSNTIVASQGIRGVTFLCKRLMFVEPVDECRFKIGAGMPLAKVCKLAQDQGLSGAEFMIGVPGTLGGAVTMNAGAMGQETSEILEYAILFNLQSGQIEHWTHDQLQFSYRKSAIRPLEMIVLGAQLRLQAGEAGAIAELIQQSLVFRQKHHPKDPNGGSVFKNPTPHQPAGRLLDDMGAKGWREGGAMISPMHANFIVNVKNATSTDILHLMLRMKRAIRERYGLEVFPENRFLGEATEEEIMIWEELTGHADHH
jgi:UDP-N-acetylmuramate dehydrogenase